MHERARLQMTEAQQWDWMTNYLYGPEDDALLVIVLRCVVL